MLVRSDVETLPDPSQRDNAPRFLRPTMMISQFCPQRSAHLQRKLERSSTNVELAGLDDLLDLGAHRAELDTALNADPRREALALLLQPSKLRVLELFLKRLFGIRVRDLGVRPAGASLSVGPHSESKAKAYDVKPGAPQSSNGKYSECSRTEKRTTRSPAWARRALV